MDRTVRDNFKNKFFVISFLFYTKVFNTVFYIFDRCKNGIDSDHTQLRVRFLVFFCRNIPSPLFDGDFNVQLNTFFKVTNNQIRVQYLESRDEFLKICCFELFLPTNRDGYFFFFRLLNLSFKSDLFKVQNDLCNVFYNTGNRREFVFYIFQFNRSNCKSFQRR